MLRLAAIKELSRKEYVSDSGLVLVFYVLIRLLERERWLVLLLNRILILNNLDCIKHI